ncbi:DUF2000 domain-containing protein [Serratia sp. M24T3]|uniref:DUF2000 domain-containing protein n=1 Tax=Serratia sp. M24T3 TaxID=932213 RepID=UPI00025B8F22|nr:DUF2000 domain-containing protein [Serratia sp. M24T3]EIC84308.1 hypothetical protein SPM24T3_12554 [Serratia sp. M24T3]
MRIAVIVNPELPVGLLANTSSAVAIGLAAKFPMLAGEQLADIEGKAVDVSSKLPVPILQATAEQIQAILHKAMQAGGEVAIVPFPAFARAMHSFEDYRQAFPARNLSLETLDGLGLAGPEKWVKSLTGSLKLLR